MDGWLLAVQQSFFGMMQWSLLIFLFLWLYSILLAFYPHYEQPLQNIGFIIICSLSIDVLNDGFQLMKDIISIITLGVEAIVPLLVVLLTVLQGLFLMTGWGAPIFVLANGFLFVCEKLLLPALVIVLMLQLVSRIVPKLSMLKAAQFIKRSILSFISIVLFLITSTIAFSASAIASLSTVGQTAKRLLEQNIPLIGSLLNDGLVMMKKFFAIPVTMSGAALMGSFLVALSLPIVKLLLMSICFYVLSAISEPLNSGQMTNLLEDFGSIMMLMCGIAVVVCLAVLCNGWLLFLFIQWATGRVL